MLTKQEKIEDVHRKMALALIQRHSSYSEKWRLFGDLVDELGDVLFPAESKCPRCGSFKTKTTVRTPGQDSPDREYIKTCKTCAHSWETFGV